MTKKKTVLDNTEEFINKIDREFSAAFPDDSKLLESAASQDVQFSLAISAKRMANALERIADALAKQTNTATDIFKMVEKL